MDVWTELRHGEPSLDSLLRLIELISVLGAVTGKPHSGDATEAAFAYVFISAVEGARVSSKARRGLTPVQALCAAAGVTRAAGHCAGLSRHVQRQCGMCALR